METVNINIDKVVILVKKAALEFGKVSNQILSEYDLTDSQYKILKYLYASPSGAARIVDLENYYSMTHPTTLGLVGALEKKGFTVRVKNPNDARGKLVSLTDKAHAMKDALYKAGAMLEKQATANLDAAERKQLVALLQKLLGLGAAHAPKKNGGAKRSK